MLHVEAVRPIEMTAEPTRFSEREMVTLMHICDTFIPSLMLNDDQNGFYERKASDLAIPRLLAVAIEQAVNPATLTELRWFLQAVENPLINRLFSQTSKPFSLMNLTERTKLLRSWETSQFNFRRKAFQSLKRLSMMLYYTVVDEKGQNPNWSVLNYHPPTQRAEKVISSIQPFEISEDSILYTDVVIVGSGAGGGVVAGELSAAGLDVIVLEKGSYYNETDLDGYELNSYQRMFENRGLITSHDLSMLILAGSTLGGGTTVNWAASFRTPNEVLQEWEQDYGLSDYNSDAYQMAMDAVSERINVNTHFCQANPQNAVLEKGAEKLGIPSGVIPRNVRDCQECGFCNFGCRFGAKQSTLRTYLQDAHDRGSRIIVQSHVDQILVEYGKAKGVIATVISTNGTRHKTIIYADVVVVSAGSLHTPALLLRSGLGNAHIGRNLHLHPTTATYGLYDEPVRGWEGPIMSRFVSAFNNQDGCGYGATLETAPIHPGIAALSLSWADGHQHKQTMLQLEHLANTIILTRDYYGGRVAINKQGQPVVHYNLNPYDANHMMRGVLESIRIHEAAGAYQIGAPFAFPVVWQREYADFDSFLRIVSETKLKPNGFALYSAHQMSSCRLASSPARGALKPTGETYEVKNLYVADGSILPTASGVNPMLTIMSVAYMIATYIKSVHVV